MNHYTSMHTHICTHVSDARAIHIMQIDFAEFCRGESVTAANMLNVHHMHTWVCTVFKWNYEQHLYTHTLIPIINRFASTNEPLKSASIVTNNISSSELLRPTCSVFPGFSVWISVIILWHHSPIVNFIWKPRENITCPLNQI